MRINKQKLAQILEDRMDFPEYEDEETVYAPEIEALGYDVVVVHDPYPDDPRNWLLPCLKGGVVFTWDTRLGWRKLMEHGEWEAEYALHELGPEWLRENQEEMADKLGISQEELDDIRRDGEDAWYEVLSQFTKSEKVPLAKWLWEQVPGVVAVCEERKGYSQGDAIKVFLVGSVYQGETAETARELLRKDIDAIAGWAFGDTYGVRIEWRGEVIETVYGFYGRNERVQEQIAAAAAEIIAADLQRRRKKKSSRIKSMIRQNLERAHATGQPLARIAPMEAQARALASMKGI